MGYRNRGGVKPVASCWLEPPEDEAGIAEWEEMMRRMEDITTSTFDLDVSDTYFLSPKCEDRPRLLRVLWRSKHPIPERNRGRRRLPVFNKMGKNVPPRDLSEVPFGESVRVLFEVSYSRGAVYGELLKLAVLPA
ncbi:hypothetical protein PHLCEN_2v8658 [Hermanssonia centrifuga]|uniref:Uncharacterized protein n=1 Tax=Hermanssonia centrifuga TaxID=98765 RepID=A0A2R6NTT1_9APHY|nr:hypothetical protein PHLCEN_2v8658 [Hermanssonia centrifuga]